MSVSQLKSKPEQNAIYRLHFKELPTINRSTLGHYCSNISVGGAGGAIFLGKIIQFGLK